MNVKICCISSIQEAEIAINCGATAIGLVGSMPSGPGIISQELIRKIKINTPPNIDTFYLTSQTTAEKIIHDYSEVETSTIQLVDEIENDQLSLLRKRLPNVELVQVIHVINEKSVLEAIEKSQYVDRILLDSGNPSLTVKELGGTGKTHNWELSKRICELLTIPVILAGGINASNVINANKKVNPSGVDLCSGVRTKNKLDESKLQAFFDTLNS